LCYVHASIFLLLNYKELRCREEELSKAQLHQRIFEQHLLEKEQELKAREFDLLQRELHMMMTAQQQEQQQHQSTPTPFKRKGKFKRSRLKQLKKEPGQSISFPSGAFFRRLLSPSSLPSRTPRSEANSSSSSDDLPSLLDTKEKTLRFLPGLFK
jgi:mitogen-activated protein kinase kinase kinase 9